MSYLSQGLKLYQRERHVHLAGEVVTPITSGILLALTSDTYFYPISLPGRRKKKVRKGSISYHTDAVALTLCVRFL